MDELLMKYSKQHAPDKDESYHRYTVWLMKHMMEMAQKK